MTRKTWILNVWRRVKLKCWRINLRQIFVVSQYVPVELNKENELNFNPEVTSTLFRLVASFPKNNEENYFTC